MKTRKLFIGLAVLGALALIGCFAVMLGFDSKPPPLPNPNGYDGFVQAGHQVTGDVGNFRELDAGSLEKLVSANAEALRLLRVSLTEPSRMPVESALNNMSGLMGELADVKHLAQLLSAEGQLHKMDNQPARAAGSYTDAIQLGNQISQGGLLITRLVGIACEAIGYQGLASVVPELNPAEAGVILNRLTKIDASRVTWAEVMQSERLCSRDYLRKHWNPVVWAVGWWNTRQSVQKAEVRHKTATSHERLLMAELALRCYRTETGSAPLHLDELVTKYLSKIPQDPFTGRAIIYRPQAGTNWIVYSVGPDRVDDGGRPASRGQPIKGDIQFNSSW